MTTMKIRTTILTLIYAAICAAIVLLASTLAAQTPSTCLVRSSHGNYSDCGSGVLIAHGAGDAEGISLLATAAHVVRGGGSITVTMHGTSTPIRCKLVGFDGTHDVAIIAGPVPGSIQPAPVTTEMAAGDRVVREGYPGAAQIRVVQSTIANLNRRYSGSRHGLVTITTPASDGESGGPVYDSQGRVVGLICTTDKVSTSSGPSAKAILACLPDDSWRTKCQICPPGYQTAPARPQGLRGGHVSAPPAPKPISPAKPLERPSEVDLDALAGKIIERMAADERFRGPQGNPGPAGPPGPAGKSITGPAGPPGRDGKDCDPAVVTDLTARLAEAERKIDLLKKLLDEAQFNCEVVSPSGEVLSGAVHANGGLLRLDFSSEGGH